MRNFFTLASVLCFSSSHAQQKQLSYGDFLQFDTTIKWAAEVDTPFPLVAKRSEHNLGSYYYNELKKGVLKGYTVNQKDMSVMERYLTKADIKNQGSGEYITKYQLRYGLQSLTKNTFDTVGCFCDTYAGGNDIELFKVKQIVYYKSGKFLIENVLVSPLCYQKDEHGIFNWFPSFNTSFNNNPHQKYFETDLLYLGASTISYDLNDESRTATDRRLLTLQNPNPIYSVLQDALKGKVKLMNELDQSGGKKPFPAKELFTFGMPSDTIAVYDPTGNFAKYQTVRSERNPENIVIALEQEFYFDRKNQVLLSRVNKAVIKERRYSQNSKTFLGLSPLCSIIYQP